MGSECRKKTIPCFQQQRQHVGLQKGHLAWASKEQHQILYIQAGKRRENERDLGLNGPFTAMQKPSA